MTHQLSMRFAYAVIAICAVTPLDTRAQYAAQVISYTAGTTASSGFTTTPSAAIGEPERFSGETSSFPSVVSPFSPPFLSSEVISIGEGGQITLRLSNFAVAQASGPPE